MDTITIFNENRDYQKQNLKYFTTYLPFGENQLVDSVKYALENPDKYVFSLDTQQKVSELKYQQMWKLMGNRIGRFSVNLDRRETYAQMGHLIVFQKWFVQNELDGIIFVIDYSQISSFNGMSEINTKIESLIKWKRQTEQLIRVKVPMVIATYHDASELEMTMEEQLSFDSIVVNLTATLQTT